MKYSRSIVMILLGTECFSEEELNQQTLRRFFSFQKPLDIFATLLFFFVYENDFSPSRFLQFFCGMKKISDLKDGKQKFLGALSSAFDQLAQVRINGYTFFEAYHREKNNWKYKLSSKALQLEPVFFSEMEEGAFWLENKRRGISVAYLGAYIYLMGFGGKEKIDLSYCGKQKLIKDFSPGYDICGMRSTIKELVQKFSLNGIFQYGKRLENLNDHILHVRQNTLGGLTYHEKRDPPIKKPIPRSVYYCSKRVETEYVFLDFEKNLKELRSIIDYLNTREMDVRHQGIHLRLPYYLDYQNNHLNKLLKYQWPGSRLKYSGLADITFGAKTPCSIITIDYLRTLYILSRLKRGRKRIEFNTPLAGGRSITTIALMVEKAWEAMLKYTSNKKQMYLVFRKNVFKYARTKATDEQIEQFFQFLTNDYFDLQNNLLSNKHVPTECNFLNESIKIFFDTAAKNYENGIQSIAGERVLIVPAGKEKDALQNLVNSYRQNWGDIRRVKFKVSTLTQTEYYHFTAPEKSSQVDEKWLPDCLIY